MRPIARKTFCIFLSIALVAALYPAAAYSDALVSDPEASFDSEQISASSEDLEAMDASIPTEEELSDAATDQLIVTYKDASAELDQDISVADLDGSDLEDVAESDPVEHTTLSGLGAVATDDIVAQNDSKDIPATSLLTFEEGTDLQEVSAQLLSSPDIESVQPNFKYELSAVGATSYRDATASQSAKHASNDPYSYVSSARTLNQSYIYTTKVADAWDAGYKSNGKVEIAVIDTGPRLDHPDLAGCLDTANARDLTTTSSGYGVPYTDSPSYWTGKTGNECHGTWVSGVLGAAANNYIGIAGASFNAKILPIKVTDGKTLYTSIIIRAYSYLDSLIESGKAPTLKVINLSLGGKQSDSKLKSAIDHLANSHNVLTVASAGNYGDKDPTYPSDYSNVLSVMGVSSNFKRSYFSSYGNKDVSAPAESITTTIPYSTSWYTTATGKYSKSGIDGTSFSAPIASGVAALCYAMKPTALAEEVRQSIILGATSLKSVDSECAPLLNALQAVKNVVSGRGLYEITHISITGAKVASISAKTYTGKRLKPSPKVTLAGKTLKKGRDYTLTYSYNKYPGKATITIKAMGSYKGSKKVTFSIIPKMPKISSIKTSRKGTTVRWTASRYCSSGYQIRYSAYSKRYKTNKLKSGRTITISGKSKRTRTITKAKKGKRYYYQIRAYRTSKGVRYYSKWSVPKRS